ncbi:MAG: glycerol-3-phosphate dehydrogenase [Betaproteobacteria bacterium RIFCSPLOWO2_02_FULL_64_12]|nr:MAG: glycerol-3-phosphate dehydrogenase [Betaproteobacteria bacterium RIFCSPLOWO2_02_FULL_64_12]
MNVAIFGAGAWGTALATALSLKHRVALWARDKAQAESMRTSRRNQRYLPDIAIPTTVEITSDAASALRDAAVALAATPTGALRETLGRLRNLAPAVPIVWACKGFEPGSARLPHQIAAEELGANATSGALSGPSFALEVAQGRPTALTLASRDEAFARSMALDLHQRALRVYYSTDVAGVEIGGAVKNVMAIATGICDGLALGLNARAALITRGLAEITRLGVGLGGRPETFMGLAGAGDLILTCTGDLSRNRRVGLLLAQGLPLQDVLDQLGHVAEGVYSAQEVQRIAAAQGIEMPITQAVCSVLFHGVAPREAVEQLLARDPKGET